MQMLRSVFTQTSTAAAAWQLANVREINARAGEFNTSSIAPNPTAARGFKTISGPSGTGLCGSPSRMRPPAGRLQRNCRVVAMSSSGTPAPARPTCSLIALSRSISDFARIWRQLQYILQKCAEHPGAFQYWPNLNQVLPRKRIPPISAKRLFQLVTQIPEHRDLHKDRSGRGPS